MALVPVGLCYFPIFNFSFTFPPAFPGFTLPFLPNLNLTIDLSCPLN
jgi:hypothetical protein